MRSIKLFCIPYAGGSSFAFVKWKKFLSSSIELCPVELAGRGRRFGDPLYNSMDEAIEDVKNIIIKSLNSTEYAVFGHSMGSIIAYEACRRLIKEGIKPAFVFCSGRKALHLKYSGAMLHNLPEERFKDEILKLGGTPKELFDNPEVLNVFNQILRADYKITETYSFSDQEWVLDCPLTVFYGDEDQMIKDGKIEEWSKFTNNKFELHKFRGGHFFINTYIEEIVDIINYSLINTPQT